MLALNEVPWASVMVQLAVFSLLLSYLFHYLRRHTRRTLDNIRLVFIGIGFTNIVFMMNHYPYGQEMRIAYLICAGVWGIAELITYVNKPSSLRIKHWLFRKVLGVLVASILIFGIGCLFRVQHWPRGITLMNIGCASMIAYILWNGANVISIGQESTVKSH